MNRTASVPLTPAHGGGGFWLFLPLVLLGGLATAGAAVASNGSAIVACVPALLAVGVVVVWNIPLRYPLFLLIFLGLALDASRDGPWDSPVAPLGALMFHNLNKTIPVAALTVPLMAICLVFLLIVHVHRRLSASRIDVVARPASPVMWGLGVSLLAVAALCAAGTRQGGDLQMAKNQVQSFVLLLATAYLTAVSFRGTRDYRILAGIVVAAACVKASMAIWVSQTVVPTPSVATSHGDSLLFAAAATILIVRVTEHPVWRKARLSLLLLPIILLGIQVNNRRLAWVELAAVLLTLWLVSRRTRFKRIALQVCLVALPLIVVYVNVGWESQSSLFAPVKLYRSIAESDTDQSTLYRDLENLNLLYTLSFNQLIGTGFGHPFAEVVKMADISFFKEYRFLPHNSILGLWAFTGLFGFTALSAALVMGVLCAARSYNVAQTHDQRVAAFCALAMVVIYEIQCYGDIGFSDRIGIFLVGPAVGVAGQLAVSTGAWGRRRAHGPQGPPGPQGSQGHQGSRGHSVVSGWGRRVAA